MYKRMQTHKIVLVTYLIYVHNILCRYGIRIYIVYVKNMITNPRIPPEFLVIFSQYSARTELMIHISIIIVSDR